MSSIFALHGEIKSPGTAQSNVAVRGIPEPGSALRELYWATSFRKSTCRNRTRGAARSSTDGLRDAVRGRRD